MTITGITTITAIGMASEGTGVTIITDTSSSGLGRSLSKRAINRIIKIYTLGRLRRDIEPRPEGTPELSGS
jgi:hypothetical protein